MRGVAPLTPPRGAGGSLPSHRLPREATRKTRALATLARLTIPKTRSAARGRYRISTTAWPPGTNVRTSATSAASTGAGLPFTITLQRGCYDSDLTRRGRAAPRSGSRSRSARGRGASSVPPAGARRPPREAPAGPASRASAVRTCGSRSGEVGQPDESQHPDLGLPLNRGAAASAPTFFSLEDPRAPARLAREGLGEAADRVPLPRSRCGPPSSAG